MTNGGRGTGRDRSSGRGIEAGGMYVPKSRVSVEELRDAWGTVSAPGIRTKAVPGADEDALTMGVAAAETALERSAVDRSDFAWVGVATTTPPSEEGLLVSPLVRALGLATDVATATNSGSTLAAAELLESALVVHGPALVVASDCPGGEPADADHRMGAGAAALVVSDEAPVPVLSRSWTVEEFPGVRFREQGSRFVESLEVTTYEREAIGSSIESAVAGLDVASGAIDAIALHQPDGKLPYRIARSLPVESEAVGRGVVVDRIGDAGAATVPIGLLAAIGTAGADDRTVAAFFGGGAAAMTFEGGLDIRVESTLEGRESISYAEYVRRRGQVVSEEVEGGGATVSVPTWRRTLESRYRLVAGRCPECGALSFPPEGACRVCHARVKYEPVELPRTGTVAATTTVGQGGAPPEFEEQQQRDGSFGAAIIRFDSGDETVRLPGQVVECDPESVAVGDEVRAVFRKVYEQQGVPRYGVKFVPQ